MTAHPAKPRTVGAATLLEVVRGGYGALQLAAPGLVAGLLLSRRLDTRTRAVVRVLGTRQLAQALASGGSPSYPVLALGVEVDLLHAGSMVALGIADHRRRSVALLDALIAASFALAGTLADALVSGADQQRAPVGGALDWLRANWAERLAGVLVPGYARRSTPQRRTPHLSGLMQGTVLHAVSSEKPKR